MQDSTPAATQENVDKPKLQVAWPRISAWYWAAIGVIALAALAQFFQTAPVTTPATVVSAALAPDVTLQIAYPREVRPVLRDADRAPLAITLQGAGDITYTVALSTSTPLLFTDSSQEVVDPRAALTVNGCCQSSAVFYPQASSEAWQSEPVKVSAYAAPTGAPLPNAPTLAFTLAQEPVWWTWGRRALLLFAELGLAVSVALALGGWAIEQQKRRQEQAEREIERNQEQYERWEARLQSARRLCEENLLTGMGKLFKLREEIEKTEKRDWKQDRLLQEVIDTQATIKAGPDSNHIEECLQQVTRRLESKDNLLSDELNAMELLFYDDHNVSDGDKLKKTLEALSGHAREQNPDTILTSAKYLFGRFEYSPAVRNLVVTLINEWYKATGSPTDKADDVLGEFRYLLHDPRLVHIPFGRRTLLYRWPDLGSYRYPWISDLGIKKLEEYFDMTFPEAITTFTVLWGSSPNVLVNQDDPRLVKVDYKSPHILQFPRAVDAECGSFILNAQLHRELRSALQDVDQNHTGSGHRSRLAPFPALVDLRMVGWPHTAAVQPLYLRSFVRAIGDSWIKLLACNPDLWSGLLKSQKEILAGLLMFTTASESVLGYRLLSYSLNEQCKGRSDSDVNVSESDLRYHSQGELRIDKLSRDIGKNYRSANLPGEPDEDMLVTWLSVRPPFLTHTVIVTLVRHNLGIEPGENLLDEYDHLSRKLLQQRVVVHLAIPELPHSSQSQLPLKCSLADCRCSNDQLNEIVKDVFGHTEKSDALSSVLTKMLPDYVDDTGQLSEKILTTAHGSPGRLCHILYQILCSVSDSPGQALTPAIIEDVLRTNNTSE